MMTVSEFLADIEKRLILVQPMPNGFFWHSHDAPLFNHEDSLFTMANKQEIQARLRNYLPYNGVVFQGWQMHNLKITRQRVIQGQLSDWPGQEHPTSYRRS